MIAVHESVTPEGRAIDVRVEGGIDVRVLPDRGFDLGDAWFRGRRIAWVSPLGETRWRGDFARSFGGGLVVTCGLRNVGVPSEGHPQHGTYTSLPAEQVRVDQHEDRVDLHARIVDAEVPGSTLVVERHIAIDGGVSITDTTRNDGPTSEPAPLLYHCNLLWSGIESDAAEVVPRDADAAGGDWRSSGPPGPERVYEHVGATRAVVSIDTIHVLINTNLPRLWQWIHPFYGVLGVEPANCSVLGRAHDRAERRLPILEPGEERVTTVTMKAEVA
jgi:hypothetical protein